MPGVAVAHAHERAVGVRAYALDGGDLALERLDDVFEWGSHVVVWGHWRGAGKRSGTPMQSRWLGVFSFAEGKIVSIANLGGIGLLPGSA